MLLRIYQFFSVNDTIVKVSLLKWTGQSTYILVTSFIVLVTNKHVSVTTHLVFMQMSGCSQVKTIKWEPGPWVIRTLIQLMISIVNHH